jgi:hypothetical protein
MNFSNLNKFDSASANKEALQPQQIDYDNYIDNALAIWNILGITEQEYYKKYQPAIDISNNFIIATDLSGSIQEPLVGDVDKQTEK